jgi:hypothetical protein
MKSIVKRLSTVALLVAAVSPGHALDMNESIRTYLANATLSEVGSLSGTNQQIAEFVTFVEVNWAAILPQIELLAPKTSSQEAIIAAAEYLPGRNYITFLTGLLDKHAAGKLSKAVTVGALSASTAKVGFLAFNHQHASVRALCERVKAMFPTDTDLQVLMADILSGAQKTQDGAVLFSDRRPEPEILPSN